MNMSLVEHCKSICKHPESGVGEESCTQTYQVWPSQLVYGLGIVQFDVEILVHTL